MSSYHDYPLKVEVRDFAATNQMSSRELWSRGYPYFLFHIFIGTLSSRNIA